MSVARSRLVSGVRTLCAEAPDLPLPDGLPTSLIFEELTGIEAMLLRDLDLSAKNARVVKMEIDLAQDQEDFLVPNTDFHAPAYAYLLSGTTSDFWHPVEIVDQSALPQYATNGKLAMAFSGTPMSGYFSWLPDNNQTLRVWYERGGDDSPTMAGSTEIGNLYDEYLKLQTAAQCREHLKLEVGSVLVARLAKSEMQWKKFVGRGHQRGLGAKNPALPFRRRLTSLYPDPHRFFVP